MPRYKVRVEYALAFDLDLEIEATDRAGAVQQAGEATGDAGIWSAIRDQFAAYRPRYAGGDMEVTDMRVLRTLPRPRTDAT